MKSYEIPLSEIARLIEEWIPSERDRMILKRRLIDGIPFKTLECEFSLSERQIKKIVHVGEQRIFAKSNLWSL